MVQKQNQTKKSKLPQKNPLESLLEPVFGNYPDAGNQEHGEEFAGRVREKSPHKKETIFNFREHYERENVQREVQQLLQQIKQEIAAVKRADAGLAQEMQEIDKMTVEELPARVGIYHVRFLEIILSLLRSVREKISDSKTWLEAMMSKKKKRGSLFAVRSKKMGTQYSLSQELQSARSVQ